MTRDWNGVLCGSDAAQEWLLPWWWERYSAENAFPVTFIDFGMTQKMRSWCSERAEVIPFDRDMSFVASKQQIALEHTHEWEGFYGPTLWEARTSWFRKPFALLLSPYSKTVWIDSDCEVLAPLDALFEECTPASQIALVREHATEHLLKYDPAVRYNGGVIAFMHGAEIINTWAERTIERNHYFWGDDPLLSACINEERISVVELPEIYNWRLAQGVNMNAVIHHWTGSAGKAYIKHFGGIKPKLQELISCLPRSDPQ